jgi:8-oxo-dGTP pyrophosphatase MutT (NUDIX family)
MKPRAAIILIEKDKIALIERYRSGNHYLVFPGGKVKNSEIPIEAAAREAEEELGLKTTIGKMVAEVWYLGAPQYYYLASSAGGEFGQGAGREMNSAPDSEKGSYLPIWVSIDSLLDLPVLPRRMAEFILKSYHEGWPEAPLTVTDTLLEGSIDQ